MTEPARDLSTGAPGAGCHLGACRNRRARVGAIAAAIGTGMALVLAPVAAPHRPLLVWNASASAPVGLYAIGPAERLSTGDMVIARVPSAIQMLAARRLYIPANVPLVKRIAAGPGDTVCALGRAIWINGIRVADRLRRDRAGRLMPWWTGCVRLGSGVVFLLMADHQASFDGRYFGPTLRRDIIGKATLRWAH